MASNLPALIAEFDRNAKLQEQEIEQARKAIKDASDRVATLRADVDRLGKENVCANIELSLAGAREILGLPPASPSDPLHAEKQKLEAARQELASALERAHKMLNSPGGQSK